MTFSAEGQFSLKRGSFAATGNYELAGATGAIILSYEYENALRSMVTKYSLSEDGMDLAIDRTWLGTILLHKNAAYSVYQTRTHQEVSNRRDQTLNSMEFSSISEKAAALKAMSQIANTRAASRGIGINREQSGGESSVSDNIASIEDKRSRDLRFNFQNPKKTNTYTTNPNPKLWPVLGLQGWQAYARRANV